MRKLYHILLREVPRSPYFKANIPHQVHKNNLTTRTSAVEEKHAEKMKCCTKKINNT